MLVTVSVIDIQCYRLPDRIVLPTMVASLVLVVVESLRAGEATQIQYALAGAAIYFLLPAGGAPDLAARAWGSATSSSPP